MPRLVQPVLHLNDAALHDCSGRHKDRFGLWIPHYLPNFGSDDLSGSGRICVDRRDECQGERQSLGERRGRNLGAFGLSKCRNLVEMDDRFSDILPATRVASRR